MAAAFVADLDACPRCHASWKAQEIPEASRHNYGGKTHYSRLIGNSVNDRIAEWVCPDCQGRFDRNAKVAI